MAIAVVLEPSPFMSVAWMVSVYSGTLWGEKESGSGRPLHIAHSLGYTGREAECSSL